MPVPAWIVTSQQPDQYDFTAPGNPVLGTVIFFSTAAGNNGSLFVPQSVYGNLKHVKSLIAAKVRQVDEVGALAGPDIPGS